MYLANRSTLVAIVVSSLLTGCIEWDLLPPDGTSPAATGDTGQPEPTDPDATPAASGAYLRTTSASTPLAETGLTPILEVEVDAGEWLVTAEVTAVNFGAADYVRCVLLADGVQLDASTTLVGNSAPGPTGEAGPSAATIPVQALVRLEETAPITLECSHDFAQAGLYLDPDASLRVIPAVAAVDQVTTTSVGLPSSGTAALADVDLDLGSWAVFGKATPVNFGGADYARGVLVDGAGAVVDASATLVGNAWGGPTGERGPSAATVQMLALEEGSDTIDLGVLHDFYGSGPYVDPWASIVAIPAPEAHIATKMESTVLSSSGGVFTDVVTLDLPAGIWALNGKGAAVSFGGADYVRCLLFADADPLDSSATLVGNASPGFTGELGPSAATIAVQGLVELPADATIRLSCLHDASSSGPYIDPRAIVMAIPVAGPVDAR